jgi:hypothetical protein
MCEKGYKVNTASSCIRLHQQLHSILEYAVGGPLESKFLEDVDDIMENTLKLTDVKGLEVTQKAA